MQRLKTRAQFEAAMAGGTISRTPHFVLHRCSLDALSASPRPPSEQPGPAGSLPVSAKGRGSAGPTALFVVADQPWIGAVVPKRWAKRAVTRNGIKRQIYSVSSAFEARLPVAALVVRLRTDFARKEFPSAWSDALKSVVRAELQQLFERVKA
ncbi:ribonuclease P protein component [Ramlibacter sp. XY19]|uniref:ribonuclease P protein component n=1 Tax=Ramlibacter paludis TaxID=2908000 RepID=UPI0023D9DE16|nr:ribonuclease P protein component [Ramlibacter paludis]